MIRPRARRLRIFNESSFVHPRDSISPARRAAELMRFITTVAES